MSGEFLLIFICNFHVLSHLLLNYICKLHWNLNTKGSETVKTHLDSETTRLEEMVQRGHETNATKTSGGSIFVGNPMDMALFGIIVIWLVSSMIKLPLQVIYMCNFHVLSHLLLIYICKLHWNLNTMFVCQVNYF